MKVSPLLQRLVDRARLPVMMRAALQRAFDAATLDRWFETVAQQQYTKKRKRSGNPSSIVTA